MSDIPDGVPEGLDKPLTEWTCPDCKAVKVFPNESKVADWAVCCFRNLTAYLTEIPANQLKETLPGSFILGDEEIPYRALKMIPRRDIQE